MNSLLLPFLLASVGAQGCEVTPLINSWDSDGRMSIGGWAHPFGGVILTTLLYLITARVEPLQEIQIPTEEFIKNRQGILSTFDLNVTSKNVKMTWKFTLPKDALFTIRVQKLKFHFKMDSGCRNCCPENALYVPYAYQGGQHVFCAFNIFETITAMENNFLITFTSEYVSQGVQLQFSIRRKTEMCSRSSFQCFDKRGCYNINNICDGVFDCEDHTDEQNCLTCRTNYTVCNNEDRPYLQRNCFDPELHRCDGILHCRTGEDELSCVDQCKNQIQCANKTGCYTLDQRCNGIFDCEDHSDEVHCHSIKCELLSNTSNYFVCKNGWCIRKIQLHDGINDCDDGSDELSVIVNNFPVVVFAYGPLLVIVLFLTSKWWRSGKNLLCFRKQLTTEQTPSETSVYHRETKCPTRNAGTQISRPIVSSERILESFESVLTNSTSTESFPLFQIGSSSASLMQSYTTTSKSDEESHEGIYHTINPSVIEKRSKNHVYKKAYNTPGTVNRFKSCELWI